MSRMRIDKLCYDVNVTLILSLTVCFYISAMSCRLLKHEVQKRAQTQGTSDSQPVIAIHVFITEIGAVVFSCGCNCSDSSLMADT